MPGAPPSDADSSARHRARVALVLCGILGVLVLREGWREVCKVRPSTVPIDERYASLVGPTRGERRIGLLGTSADEYGVDPRRVELEYALAPAVVVPGTEDVRLVAAWADTAEALAALAARHGLRLVAVGPDGLALFEKAKP